jgi:hypothetical protein
VSGDAPYLLCPACRTEYLRAASRCAECDVELVEPGALAERDEALDAFPPAADLSCVRVAPLPWVRALSEALQQEGVVHRVETARVEDAPDGQRPQVFGEVRLFGLYVRGEDAPAARELDASIAAALLPGEAPPLAEGEEEACPACGTGLARDATECPECGLGFA